MNWYLVHMFVLINKAIYGPSYKFLALTVRWQKIADLQNFAKTLPSLQNVFTYPSNFYWTLIHKRIMVVEIIYLMLEDSWLEGSLYQMEWNPWNVHWEFDVGQNMRWEDDIALINQMHTDDDATFCRFITFSSTVVFVLSLASLSLSVCDSSTISLMADTRDEGQLRVKGGRVADDGFDIRFWHAIYSLAQCTKRSKIKAGRKNEKNWKLLKDRGYTMKNTFTKKSIYRNREEKIRIVIVEIF